MQSVSFELTRGKEHSTMKTLVIKQERLNKTWTIERVAKRVGITKQSMHCIENGINKPSYNILIKLCKEFQVPCEPIEQLFAVADEGNSIMPKGSPKP